MIISYSIARWVATASFLFDLVAQSYGIFSDPNLKTIHDQNLSFFSPQPFFIAGFFFPLQLIQLAWLYRLWKLDRTKSAEESQELGPILSYVPCYVLGNMCLGAWVFFWNASLLKASNIFVCINTVAQVYFVAARLLPMNLSSQSSVLTHIVSKMFAGLGVLDILHNTSVAYFKDQPATMLVRVLTGVGFGLASATSDWIMGFCLVYDLVALAVGQSGTWRTLLGIYAAGAALIVGAKNIARPPYQNNEIGYDSVDTAADGEEH